MGPTCCPAKRDWGWEAARPCVSKEAKPAKIDSLIEKNFGGAQLKKLAQHQNFEKIFGAVVLKKFFCFARRSEAEARGNAGRDCRPQGGNQKSQSGFSLKKIPPSLKLRRTSRILSKRHRKIKKRQQPLFNFAVCFAEGVGLEPTRAFQPAGFQDRWNNQLSDPSNYCSKSFIVFLIMSTY